MVNGNVTHHGVNPNANIHYTNPNAGHSGGNRKNVSFFKALQSYLADHRTLIRELLYIFLIYLLMRLFRQFVFSCPCSPYTQHRASNVAGVVGAGDTRIIDRERFAVNDPRYNQRGSIYGGTAAYPYNDSRLDYGTYRDQQETAVVQDGSPHTFGDRVASVFLPARANRRFRPFKLSMGQYEAFKRDMWANRRIRKIYSLLFLLVPAVCLMLLKLLFREHTWKTVTGLCSKKPKGVQATNDPNVKVKKSGGLPLPALGMLLLLSFLPAIEWLILSLMDGKFLTCGYSVRPCDPNHLHSRQIRARSQMIGWILLLTLLLAYILAKCFRAMCGKMNYYEKRFNDIYRVKEANEFERLSRKNAKSMATRHVEQYFNHGESGQPRWWEKVAPTFDNRGAGPVAVYHAAPGERATVERAYRPVIGSDEERQGLTAHQVPIATTTTFIAPNPGNV